MIAAAGIAVLTVAVTYGGLTACQRLYFRYRPRARARYVCRRRGHLLRLHGFAPNAFTRCIRCGYRAPENHRPPLSPLALDNTQPRPLD